MPLVVDDGVADRRQKPPGSEPPAGVDHDVEHPPGREVDDEAVHVAELVAVVSADIETVEI